MDDDGEDITRETEYFQAFPDVEEVFANRVEEHSKYLLPLAKLDVGRLSSDMTGFIPIVMPIEPAGGWGEVGDRSKAYHNYLCRPAWVGYRLIDGKLELACDFRFFHRAYFQTHPPTDQHAESELENLGPYYELVLQEFEHRRRYFRAHGSLIRSEAPYREGEPVELDTPWIAENGLPLQLFSDFGGECLETNWASTDFPLSIYPQPEPELTAEDRALAEALSKIGATYELRPGLPVALPRTEDGRDFRYLGCVSMETYVGDIADGLVLVFFDPRDQIVLTTFDWS
jgi:hypothetical protein